MVPTMAESNSGSRRFETDKFGNKCAERTFEVAKALATETDAFEVVIHDADTGRIGYRSKRTVVNDRVLDVARERGYRVDLISATSYEQWDGEFRKCAGIEFVPTPPTERDIEAEELVRELEEEIEATEVPDDE